MPSCQIMSSIHHACLEYTRHREGRGDYIKAMKGANIAQRFMKVAKSMVEQGVTKTDRNTHRKRAPGKGGPLFVRDRITNRAPHKYGTCSQ